MEQQCLQVIVSLNHERSTVAVRNIKEHEKHTMTIKKSLLLLLLLSSQHLSADFCDCVKSWVKPTLITSGVIGTIYFLVLCDHHITINNTKNEYSVALTQFTPLIQAYNAGEDWVSLIFSHSAWGLTTTPLHAFENELIKSMKAMQYRVTIAPMYADLHTLQQDLIDLHEQLQNLVRAFAGVRMNVAYAAEEQILMRDSFDEMNRIMRTPQTMYVYTV